MFDYTSIADYHAWLKTGAGSCLQAVDHYLARISEHSDLNAFVAVYADEARERASRLDAERSAGKPVGRLHGVVIGIKDVLCLKDHPVTAASAILGGGQAGKEFISLYTATSVQRLLDEEAIIIGHLNCDEFAMGSTNENSVYGPVLNAADKTRIPGGSSGGSAVAVQAGLVMVSLGSDTGGSVRQPADHCGIIGMKPSYGFISRYGLLAYASSFDQIGVFSRNISDLALVLEIMGGPDEFDSTAAPLQDINLSEPPPTGKKYRIAWFPQAIEHPSLDPEIRSAIQGLLDRLAKEGHEVRPVDFELIDHIVPAYYVLTTAEASSNLSRYDGVRYGHRTTAATDTIHDLYKLSRSEGFSPEVKRRIMLGTFVLSAGFYDAYFTQAQKVRKLLFDQTQLIFRDFDFIFMPTAPGTAYPAGQASKDPIAMYLADIYTVMANLVGIPAISLPLFTHTNGMPFGVQVLANRFNELPLLHISGHLMQP